MVHTELKLLLRILLSSNIGNPLFGISTDFSLQTKNNFSHCLNNLRILTVAFIATPPSRISADLWKKKVTNISGHLINVKLLLDIKRN